MKRKILLNVCVMGISMAGIFTTFIYDMENSSIDIITICFFGCLFIFGLLRLMKSVKEYKPLTAKERKKKRQYVRIQNKNLKEYEKFQRDKAKFQKKQERKQKRIEKRQNSFRKEQGNVSRSYSNDNNSWGCCLVAIPLLIIYMPLKIIIGMVKKKC